MQFLPKDVTTLSTTPSAYKLFLDLKEDDDDQYVLYLCYKEWSDYLIPTIQKHPETRCGVIHSQYAQTEENLKGETLTSCHSHVREKITQKLKCSFAMS